MKNHEDSITAVSLDPRRQLLGHCSDLKTLTVLDSPLLPMVLQAASTVPPRVACMVLSQFLTDREKVVNCLVWMQLVTD